MGRGRDLKTLKSRMWRGEWHKGGGGGGAGGWGGGGEEGTKLKLGGIGST